MCFWAGGIGAGQVIRRLPSLTVDPTKAPAPTDSAKKCVLSAVRGRLSERVFVRGVPRRAMRAGSPSAMRGQSSPVGDIVPDIRYCRCEVERRRCALSYISFIPCAFCQTWQYHQKNRRRSSLAPLRMSSSIDCFLSVCFRHSELMGRESRSRASRTVGQAKAPLVTLVLPLTNRTMPSFSSKDEK